MLYRAVFLVVAIIIIILVAEMKCLRILHKLVKPVSLINDFCCNHLGWKHTSESKHFEIVKFSILSIVKRILQLMINITS